MDVISRYGSIGGKTTLKPTRPGNGVLLSPTAKNAWERRHTDYGLLELRTINGVSPTHWNGFQQQFEDEMLNLLQHPAPSNLPALNRFWFAPGMTASITCSDWRIRRAPTINLNQRLGPHPMPVIL
jgi:hypothetical protein